MMERTVKKNNVSVNIVKIEESGGSHPPAKCKSREKIGGFSVRQQARLVILSHRTRKQVIDLENVQYDDIIHRTSGHHHSGHSMTIFHTSITDIMMDLQIFFTFFPGNCIAK